MSNAHILTFRNKFIKKIKILNFINYFNLLEHFLGKQIERMNVIKASTYSTEIIIVNQADAIS